MINASRPHPNRLNVRRTSDPRSLTATYPAQLSRQPNAEDVTSEGATQAALSRGPDRLVTVRSAGFRRATAQA